jgi:hypothetical protein
MVPEPSDRMRPYLNCLGSTVPYLTRAVRSHAGPGAVRAGLPNHPVALHCKAKRPCESTVIPVTAPDALADGVRKSGADAYLGPSSTGRPRSSRISEASPST